MAPDVPLGSSSRLPRPRTRLVGRELDIDTVAALLEQPETTLLTLTGPGGAGKTRLAIAVGARVAEEFRDGVWFVPLAPVNDPTFVLPTIASTVGMLEQAGAPLLEQLRSIIAERRMLLILDNFEHVISAAVDIDRLLDGCPNITVVATSRTRLRLYGEREYPVPGLTLPEARSRALPREVEDSHAIQLFVERARDINPSFQLTDTNVGLVAEICRYLDGLPLAIELAAAQTRHLSLEGISERLGHGLELLARGTRDASGRQDTLRNAIAWSVELLAPDERAVFQRLGVLRGGWTLGAAQAVVGHDVPDVSAGLQRLIDQNLIRLQPQPDGSTRYSMLETIREFALETLEASSDADELRRRHTGYFFELVEEARRRLDSKEEIVWLDRLEQEYDNLRTAIAWLLLARDVERGLLMTGNLGQFWFSRRAMWEGRIHIESFLELPGADEPGEARALALRELAWLAAFQGDAPAGLRASEEAIAIWQSRGESARLPGALNALAVAAAMGGDLDRALTISKEVVATARQVGDLGNLARALSNLSILADDAEGLTLLEEALRVAREIGSPATIALVLNNLAPRIARVLGDNESALAMTREALQIYHRMRNNWGISMSLESYAKDALSRDRPVVAARLAGAASALRDRIGTPVQSVSRADHERMIADLRSALKGEFDVPWAAGTAMSIDDVVQLALELDNSPRLEPDPVSAAGLSKRETEVLKLLVDGHSNQEIADMLFISPHTAAHHVTSILNKLGVDSRTAAATWAVKQGLA